ncbi:hypothetical protein CN582_25245 [Bacillus wiedmannii]|uniref:class II aldolase/adducin family protein n=1 Tax=Bacillus wiedmannii TaxID=1890302 RepID=UPI000BF84EA0|nr:class II aldolase/adducin family protein [Bacillus wiedmannii]PEP92448.1 hypothetical protein CN582_25245 [Bacillus wiedmannii]
MTLNGKVIYYILTGARKSQDAHIHIRELKDAGANVYVLLTPAASDMVDHKLLKEASGNFLRNSFHKNKGESLPLEDIVVIAPATYSSINKISAGISDNFALSCVAAAIGRKTPIYIAPSMNKDLWNSPIVQNSIIKLSGMNIKFIHPRIIGSYCTMAYGEKVVDSLIYDYSKLRFQPVDISSKVEINVYKKWIYLKECIYKDFLKSGKELVENDLTSGAKGCISQKIDEGFIITASGAKLGNLKEEDLVWVYKVSEESNQIFWIGDKVPSSETPLHFEAYKKKNVEAVVHSHCPIITYSQLTEKYKTENYLRYGTFDFGRFALETMYKNKSHFVIARDHGEVSVGPSLGEAINNIKDIYNLCRGVSLV